MSDHAFSDEPGRPPTRRPKGDGTQIWHRAASLHELPEGRVKSVTCGLKTVCLVHHQGQWAALDNKCPHQGGPLGEGSIENGYLRCPWHGWDFDPLDGKPPGGYDDGVETYPVEVRDDGVYVAIEEEAPHVRTISDVMAETFSAWGVRHVFGMVGHSNLGLADGLRRLEVAGELSYVGIRHEGAASFACSAYGKLTGRAAACLAIAGPGATNLLTGLWDAHVDRAPVLALTGQVDTQVLGPGAFQEIDLASAFSAVARWSQTVLHDSRHAELANLACKHALLERHVAHLIFPDEVQVLPAEGVAAGKPDGRLPQRTISPPAESLQAAIERLDAAERPVIVVGHGARFAMESIVALAEALGAPVLTTFKGKGLISDAHPLAAGVLGRSGTPIASWFMNECDLMLVFGASFSNHTGITPKKPLIQVDFDPLALGKFHAVDVPVWGEIGITAELLRQRFEGRNASSVQREELAERWRLWREEKASRREDERGEGLASAAIFEILSHAVPADAILAVDVGNNTYSFGRYFECREQAVLMSGYLGSIGFALPAALGAWAATQEDGTPWFGRKVVSISGDGGFGQYMGEMTTAVKYGMNITHVLLDNSQLGKISKEQRAGEWDVWQTSLHNPDFAAFAKNCGALGLRVDTLDELEPALERALAHDGPSLVAIHADAELI
ncbi:MAG: thiamine pyrophosphate-dependent enzyme [Acidobacteriota bacterium]